MSNIVEPTTQQIESLVNKYIPIMGDYPIGVAVGYVGPDFAQIYFQGKLQDQNKGPLRLNGETFFEIASVTKTFTATTYQYFVANDSIPADANLGTYYSGSNDSGSKSSLPGPMPRGTAIGSNYVDIPLESLANYTSGLPADNTGPVVDWRVPLPKPYAIPDMFSYLSGNPFTVGTPGEQYAYSNLGFGLLAAAVGTSQGRTFPELQREYVLDACNLGRTHLYGLLDQTAQSKIPIGYDAQVGSANPTNPGWDMLPAWDGAGGLVSTPNDMLTWLQFNMDRIADNPLNNLLYALQTPSTDVCTKSGNKLGLGWFIDSIGNDPKNSIHTIWKDGGLAGFTSYIALLQSPNPGTTPSEAGVFALTNSMGNYAVSHISNDLLFIMSGLEPPEDKSVYPRVQHAD